MEVVKNFDRVVNVSEKGVMVEDESVDVKEKNINVLISENAIKRRVEYLAKEICKNYDKDIHGIIILKGSIIFFSDLVRAISRLCNKHIFFDTFEVSSYKKTETTGKVNVIKDVGDIKGKDVLIIEDIIDTGLTIKHLKKHFLEEKKASSVEICCLLDKPSRRKVVIKTHYTGFIVPDLFIVGYGLDYEQKYRALPYIGVLKDY